MTWQKLVSSLAAKIATLFNPNAPVPPPKIKRTGRSSCNLKISLARALSPIKSDFLKGFPTIVAPVKYFNDSEKATVIILAKGAVSLLARPGRKSCWWIKLGTLKNQPAQITGTPTNPPADKIIFGLNLKIIQSEEKNPAMIKKGSIKLRPLK